MGAVPQKRQAEAKERILVVDDNLDNVRSLALLFETMGHQIEYAINATVAIDIAPHFKPDIVFLDLLLPDAHGAEVCSAIRKLPGLSKTRIFGVTASSRMIDHQIALDAGCDDVLRKPVSAETFERLIGGGAGRRKLREFMHPEAEKKGFK